ncbi:uncharacterized protein DEA37_0011841 [Paragonimus westermani]|uniref:G-protein coupled receptors family 1 profile domain-containing protein n=1 Tax=Paragonimus westermani TaxID=34504 RepID=A0A5J4P3C7_9TREM|nr:uncharacterized protein DEA37_0011841 [Paragonimus westermani]
MELLRLNEIHKVLRLTCGKILTPCFCFVGLIANTLNVVVLTRAWMSSSTNVYLTAVAVCDIFYLLFCFLFSLYAYDTIREAKFYIYSISFILGTANLFSNTNTWLTVCFTLERYIAVSSPILGRRFCTQQRARYVVAVVFLLSLFITFPDYLKRTVVVEQSPHPTNSSILVPLYRLVESSYYKYLVLIGYNYINQVLFVLIPMVLLIIFNSLLVRSVLQANKGRRGLVRHTNGSRSNIQTAVDLTSGITQSFSQSGKAIVLQPTHQRRPIFGEQQRITIMLISIVMAFVLLQLPSTVPNIADSLWKAGILVQTEINKKYMMLYSNVSNVLLIVNAAMNFVFYSLFSAKFRQTCCMLFAQCRCGTGPQGSVSSASLRTTRKCF